MDADVGVAVVGAGGGGVTAALRAGEGGSDVVLIDGASRYANSNTAMSSCMIPAAGTVQQSAAGIEDSPESLARDIADFSGDGDVQLARSLAATSRALVLWLESQGVELHLVDNFRYPGLSTTRMHTTATRSGTELLRALSDNIDRNPRIELARGLSLGGLKRLDAAWTLEMKSPDGAVEVLTAKRVILASGGFGANRQAVEKYLGPISKAEYIGSPESDGTALKVAFANGIGTSYLDSYQAHASVSDAGVPMTWASVSLGGFLVNAHGVRFGNEMIGYSGYALQVQAQPMSRAWVVFDGRILEHLQGFSHFRTIEGAGCVIQCENAVDVANAVGQSRPAAIQRTLNRVSMYAEQGLLGPFGRRWPTDPLEPPYFVVRVKPGLVHTQGGITVSPTGRALSRDGTPIEGLWAVGGAAMGLSGHSGTGYLAGNGLLSALGLGYSAGLEARLE